MSWVILDDTSSEIQYSGAWTPITPTADVNRRGNWGPVFQNTLHSATGISKLAYTFNGTHAQILGTTDDHGSQPPLSLTCLVDGVRQAIDDGRNTRHNNHCFCDARNLSPSTTHTIEFSAEVPEGSSFTFDRLQYRPLQNATLNKADLAYDSNHPQVRYEGVWKSSDDRTAKYTQVTGSKAIFTFKGTSLQWYAAFYPTFPQSESTASWSIDGSVPQSIPMRVLLEKSTDLSHPLRNQLLFEALSLSSDEHRLEVVFKGDATTLPLSLNSMVVQDGMLSSSSSFASDNGSLSHNSGNVGLSAGSKIGIGAGVTLAFVLLLFLVIFIHLSPRARKTISTQNLIPPIHASEHQPFIEYPAPNSRPTTFHPMPEPDIKLNTLTSNTTPFPVMFIPHPSSLTLTASDQLAPDSGNSDEQPARDRKASSSSIATIKNPFRTASTSASCTTSNSLVTGHSTSGPESNAWSHNHLPDTDQAGANLEAASTRLVGELRDVKRANPTLIYLQNDPKFIGSSTTIGTIDPEIMVRYDGAIPEHGPVISIQEWNDRGHS
ncbi:hypothetical protein CVT24_009608 [Panaeolus cyanescens]|uniref:Uncharacterized protein n=1 Tax=Panaeolus cyanescens TaxID=181874 RepID=A0A409YA27_9AGAR|nr:hypothetical protein CVT24_009608 [Panaeolus cyanescens]